MALATGSMLTVTIERLPDKLLTITIAVRTERAPYERTGINAQTTARCGLSIFWLILLPLNWPNRLSEPNASRVIE